MTVDYDKPLKRRFEIEGVTNDDELKTAGKILFNIYNITADIVNNGGIDKFNSDWAEKHPEWDYEDESRQEEYIGAYECWYKQIADCVAINMGSPYKLKTHSPCTIHFEEGWFKIHGYKELN